MNPRGLTATGGARLRDAGRHCASGLVSQLCTLRARFSFALAKILSEGELVGDMKTKAYAAVACAAVLVALAVAPAEAEPKTKTSPSPKPCR